MPRSKSPLRPSPHEAYFNAKRGRCIGYVGGGIYLGSKASRDVALLKALNITHVVSFHTADPYFHYKGDFESEAKAEDIKVYPITADDDETTDILTIYRVHKAEGLKAFLDEATSGNNKVLMQCMQGGSRSVTFIAFHLIENEGLSVLDSLLLLLSAGLHLQPQESFIKSMKDLEMEKTKDPKKPCSFTRANLPGIDVDAMNDGGARVAAENRKFFVEHVDRAKELRKKYPEPTETKLDIYAQKRFYEYGQTA